MIALRPYQESGITDIRAELRRGHNRIVYQLSTGGGKTVIFSFIVKNAVANGNRCMIVSNRCELLTQTGGTFARIGLRYELIKAGAKGIPTSPVSIAMVETLKRRLKTRLDFQMYVRSLQVIIIDEAHLCCFNDLFTYISPDCIVLGFTATPIRFGKMPELADYFTSLVQGPAISNLIADGFLSRPEYYGVPIDLAAVRIKGGEFEETDLQKIYTSSEVFGGLHENLARHGAGMKTIIFCPTIETSKQVAEELNCLHVDGEMSQEKRKAVLHEFESNPHGIISNVGILTIGYDHPPTQRIVLYRATKSLPLYLQIIGRGSRIAPGKSRFLILDFGNNVLRFGFWHAEREWKLNNDRKRKVRADREDIYPIKDCPVCGALVPVNTKTCEYCGHIWTKTEEEKRFVELQEMEYGALIKKIEKGMTIQEMEAIRQARNYKIGWLLRQLKDEEQFREYGRLKKYHPRWAGIQYQRFVNNTDTFVKISELEW